MSARSSPHQPSVEINATATTTRAVGSKRSMSQQSRPRLAQENPMKCKVCLQLFTEPYTTVCGHTFCRSCIVQSLQYNSQCPICETGLDTKKARTSILMSPNYTVSAMLEQMRNGDRLRAALPGRRKKSGEGDMATGSEEDEHQSERTILRLLTESPAITLASIERIAETLKRRQTELELNDAQIRGIILYEFFERMIEKRESAARHIQAEIDTLRQDRQRVANTISGQLRLSSLQRLVPDAPTTGSTPPGEQRQSTTEELTLAGTHEFASASVPSPSAATPPSDYVPERLAQLKRRMMRHLSSLETAYFAGTTSTQHLKVRNETSTEGNAQSSFVSPSPIGSVPKADLDDFSDTLKNLYRYGDIRVLATLNYNLEACNQPSIVSSIEFDKDGDFFVVAGVTKMIKLYDYAAVLDYSGLDGAHQPVVQLKCNSKISNVSWNPYNKSMLASSDYDGTVQLWDTAAAKCTRTFVEHEKRCWTVQFNNVDPFLMASGSDDGKVKLWSVMAPQSLCAIDAKVNVCCVYFSPKSRNQLVFGSSDHCVHMYDLRQLSKPLNVFRGHRKAVSYVKYANECEVVSASTDSNLRLWDVNSGKCLQTMRGHQNEKNFVGLATDGTHVVCGSENNHLYLYYKAVADPLLCFDFAQRTVRDSTPLPHQPQNPPLGASSSSALDSPFPLPPDPSLASHFPATDAANNNNGPSSVASNGDFVSAVCWRKNSDVVLAANSQGQTFVLQLT